MARIALVAVLAGLPDAFAFVAPCRHTRPTALAGAKTDAVLGLLRRVPLVKRAVPKKRQPVKYVPPITVGRRAGHGCRGDAAAPARDRPRSEARSFLANRVETIDFGASDARRSHQVDAQPDVVDLIDAVATESEGVLEAVVQSLVDRGVAVRAPC